VLLAGVGAALRVVPWLHAASLRRSEASLALQVLEPGHEPTLAPGLQLLLKAATWLGGAGELALRAVPLIAGLGALAVLVILARRHLPARVGTLAAVAFALSSPLVEAASELRAEACDALWATGLLLVGLRAYARAWIGWKTIALLGGLGIATIFCSPATVFPMLGVGVALARRAGERRLAAGCLAAAWLLSAWLAHGIPAFALAPSPRAALPALDAVGVTGWGLGPLTLTLLTASVALVIAGAVSLWRRGETGMLTMVGLPALLALPAAALGILPAALAVGPSLVVLLAHGIDRLWGEGRLRLGLGVAASVVVLGVPLARALWGLILPPAPEEMRPVLALVSERHKPGDTVLVFPDARPAFDYYHDHRPAFRLAGTHVVWCERSPCSGHLAALGPLPRLWLVMASGSPPGQLDRRGDRLTELRARGAACYLYDLKSAREEGKKNAGVGPGVSSH
jgi:hypothetical protein